MQNMSGIKDMIIIGCRVRRGNREEKVKDRSIEKIIIRSGRRDERKRRNFFKKNFIQFSASLTYSYCLSTRCNFHSRGTALRGLC